jgi:hypothetical protein
MHAVRSGRAVHSDFVSFPRLRTGGLVKCTVVQALRLCTGRTVKCTVVQALRTCATRTVKFSRVPPVRICTGHTSHTGSRVIALPFLDHGTRRGWGVSVTPRPLFTPWKDPVPIVQEAGWAQGRFGQVRKISPHRDFFVLIIWPCILHYITLKDCVMFISLLVICNCIVSFALWRIA